MQERVVCFRWIRVLAMVLTACPSTIEATGEANSRSVTFEERTAAAAVFSRERGGDAQTGTFPSHNI